jgi:hypothetical protein
MSDASIPNGRTKARGGYPPLDLAELCFPLHWDSYSPTKITGTALPLAKRIRLNQLPYCHRIAAVRPLTPALAAFILADAAARGYQDVGLLMIQTQSKDADIDTVLPDRRILPRKKRKPISGKHFIMEFDLAELAQSFMNAAQSLSQRPIDGSIEKPPPVPCNLPKPRYPHEEYNPRAIVAEDHITLVVFRPALQPDPMLSRRLSYLKLQPPEPLKHRQAVILHSLQDWLEHLHYMHQQLTVLAQTGTNAETRNSEFSRLIRIAFQIWANEPTISDGELYDKLPPDTTDAPSLNTVSKWLQKFHRGFIPAPEPVPADKSAPDFAATTPYVEQPCDPGPQWRAHHLLAKMMAVVFGWSEALRGFTFPFRYALRPLRRKPEENSSSQDDPSEEEDKSGHAPSH